MKLLRLSSLALVLAVCGVGCDREPSGSDADAAVPETWGGATRLPGQECAPACATDNWPYSPESIGLDSAYACYDGCNWYYCTDEGAMIITARGCSDGGMP